MLKALATGAHSVLKYGSIDETWWVFSVGEQDSQLTQFNRVLQQSAETRMRAIQHKLSITSTFCTSVELEIRFGKSNRAMELLGKLDSTIDSLTAHIDNPAHVSDEAFKQEFERQLAELRGRVSLLHSHVRDGRSRRQHDSEG